MHELSAGLSNFRVSDVVARDDGAGLASFGQVSRMIIRSHSCRE